MLQYRKALEKQKKDKIKSVENITFIHDGLMWQDSDVNVKLKLNRLEFKMYCKNLDFANKKDWKVPSYDEMITLVDYSKFTPAGINKIKYIIPSKYWTSSASVLEKKKNWFVNFDDGTSGIDLDLKHYNIRCVRKISSKEGEY
ncbi:MAG: hypothetical protein CSA86_01095 [Arcobacter sp.]|nr:MAG: hypothetical protein CSA86_01095 [Arcobacter sp.]